MLATAALDDRTSSHGYLSHAEVPMADAVGAEQAFFSTCGSSLSVKAAMLAVAGGRGDLLVSRDAHKSVVADLVFGGVRPQWIRPRYDAVLHLAHPPSPQQADEAWQNHPDAAGALIVSPTPTAPAPISSPSPDICHRRGKPLIVDDARGAHSPFHQDLPTWAMDAGADGASSARTRWAPASSRDRSSTGRAALSIRTTCPPAPSRLLPTAGHTGDHPRRAHHR
jgi:arginine/lysine/ornithine decarboxylase